MPSDNTLSEYILNLPFSRLKLETEKHTKIMEIENLNKQKKELEELPGKFLFQKEQLESELSQIKNKQSQKYIIKNKQLQDLIKNMGFLENALTELPKIDRRLEVLHNSILELEDKYKVLEYLEEKNSNRDRDRSSPIFFNPTPNGGKKTGKKLKKNKKSNTYKKRRTNKNKRK